MLKMVKGCKVPKARQLCEQYEVNENYITANVNAAKIESVFQHFICMQEAPIFFILELPVNELEERMLRKADTDPMHIKVYYIDNLTGDEALVLLIRYGKLLIDDGISRFGFGVQDNSAEIMLGKYNVMTLWFTDQNKYSVFFDAHNIPRAEKCITAWDTFTLETPGESNLIKTGGKTVYDLPNELKDWGIYYAEQREE